MVFRFQNTTTASVNVVVFNENDRLLSSMLNLRRFRGCCCCCWSLIVSSIGSKRRKTPAGDTINSGTEVRCVHRSSAYLTFTPERTLSVRFLKKIHDYSSKCSPQMRIGHIHAGGYNHAPSKIRDIELRNPHPH